MKLIPIIKQTLTGSLVVLMIVVASGCIFSRGGGSTPPRQGLTLDDLYFRDLADAPVELGTIAEGKPLYVVFFASWCSICMEEIPEHNRIYNQFAARGLEFYGVNIDESLRVVTKVINKKGIKYPVLRHNQRSSDARFKINALPVIALFDRDGNQVYYDSRPPTDDIIEHLLSDK